MKHLYITHKDCMKLHCAICDGGLAVCGICNGAESSLTTDCCGRKITSLEENEISNSILDFKENSWKRKLN